MTAYRLIEDRNDRLRILPRKPLFAPLLVGSLVIAAGAFFLAYQLVSSPHGFFRALELRHQWIVWMFGALFVVIGIIVIGGALKNFRHATECVIDRARQSILLRHVPFVENNEV